MRHFKMVSAVSPKHEEKLREIDCDGLVKHGIDRQRAAYKRWEKNRGRNL